MGSSFSGLRFHKQPPKTSRTAYHLWNEIARIHGRDPYELWYTPPQYRSGAYHHGWGYYLTLEEAISGDASAGTVLGYSSDAFEALKLIEQEMKNKISS